jgi:hypothetical protein
MKKEGDEYQTERERSEAAIHEMAESMSWEDKERFKAAFQQALAKLKEEEELPEIQHLDALLQKYPDLIVRQQITGIAEIGQRLPHGDGRNVLVKVPIELKPSQAYPDVIVSGVQIPRSLSRQLQERQYSEGMRTIVTIHTAADESLHAKVEYSTQYSPIPKELQTAAIPIPPYELITTARNGLELLDAFHTLPASTAKGRYHRRIFDEVGPNNSRDPINAGNRKPFALNTLKKVTKDLLP